MTITENMNNCFETIEINGVMAELLIEAMKMSLVSVDRDTFLRKELAPYCSADQVTRAIQTTPAQAGISASDIDYVASKIINYEGMKLGVTSAAISIPGALNVLGAAAVDSVNYYAFSLRVIQELAYLYGFHEFGVREDENSAETMTTIIIFLGAMFGIQEANRLLVRCTENYAANVARGLTYRSLTKGTLYPIVKKIAKELGIRMTKQIYADMVASSIPVISGVMSGGLSYFTFSAACGRLQDTLKQLSEIRRI